MIVADYRGLTMPQIDALRGTLIEHGAKFTVVKNTLTRRAAEAAGADALLTLLEGPSAIAFIESDGDMVAVAKALADSAKATKVLAIRGGLMQGKTISADDVDELAKLPPFDVLRGQVLGAIVGPLQSLLGLVTAPLQNLVGLIDARIEQLGGADAAAPARKRKSRRKLLRVADRSPEAESEPEAGAGWRRAGSRGGRPLSRSPRPRPSRLPRRSREPEAEAEPAVEEPEAEAEPVVEAEPEPEPRRKPSRSSRSLRLRQSRRRLSRSLRRSRAGAGARGRGRAGCRG